MWTVWDTVREEGHGKRKRGSISLQALTLSAEHRALEGLGISPSRLSPSGTALKGVHAIREGLRVRGALATSTLKPEGTPSALIGLACSERTQEYSVTAVRE